MLDFAAMESTLALIWASISLSLFAKPQLLFTTRLWSGLGLTAGLMLEFCGLPLEKAGSIITQRNRTKLGRENIFVWLYNNIFRSVVLIWWSIGNHWLGIIAARRKAEIVIYRNKNFFRFCKHAAQVNFSFWLYYQPQNWEGSMKAFEQIGIWKTFKLLGMFISNHLCRNLRLFSDQKWVELHWSIPAKVIIVKLCQYNLFVS